jgi:hypothetical protein
MGGDDMTCKECIHEDVCKIRHFPALFGLTGDGCPHSKNKAKMLEVSDTSIIFTKDSWLVLNMESKDLGAAIKSIIDHCTRTAMRW